MPYNRCLGWAATRPAPRARDPARRQSLLFRQQRERFFIERQLVRIHIIIEIIWWTGLAPWVFEFPFPALPPAHASTPQLHLTILLPHQQACKTGPLYVIIANSHSVSILQTSTKSHLFAGPPFVRALTRTPPRRLLALSTGVEGEGWGVKGGGRGFTV